MPNLVKNVSSRKNKRDHVLCLFFYLFCSFLSFLFFLPDLVNKMSSNKYYIYYSVVIHRVIMTSPGGESLLRGELRTNSMPTDTDWPFTTDLERTKIRYFYLC